MMQQACAVLLAAIPDLPQRAVPYRMSLGPPDPELIEALVDHIRQHQPAFRAALAGRDHAFVAGFAHGLKGMGGSVGLPEISVLGERLEAACRGRLDGELKRLGAALDAWVAAAGAAA